MDRSDCRGGEYFLGALYFGAMVAMVAKVLFYAVSKVCVIKSLP